VKLSDISEAKTETNNYEDESEGETSEPEQSLTFNIRQST